MVLISYKSTKYSRKPDGRRDMKMAKHTFTDEDPSFAFSFVIIPSSYDTMRAQLSTIFTQERLNMTRGKKRKEDNKPTNLKKLQGRRNCAKTFPSIAIFGLPSKNLSR